MKHEVTEVTEPVSLMAKYFSSSEPPASPSLPTGCNTRARPPQLGWGTCGGGPTAGVARLLLDPCQEKPPCPFLTHPSKKKQTKYTALEAPFPCVYLRCQLGSFSQSPWAPHGMGPASEWDWCHLLSPLFLLPET